ncbi:dihydrofolate reductase isoform X3 [Syngnathus typhle]|uniref:dihydrofolate reductase isoform X3 n=1 Tax=Syngnathus typhle TaxID=161592 RepID=UPI002A6B0357|nr:dihydrofolate reductase isoform X3 [Syngnathus typhle]
MPLILNGIVAMCPDLGIGRDGHLPWHPTRLKVPPTGAHHLAPDFCSALRLIDTELSDQADQVWVIGGSSLYKELMLSQGTKRLFVTQVLKQFPCDTFFPEFCSDKYNLLPGANLAHELPGYRQHVTCPTRGAQTLDHCYTVIKDAYHSAARAALGLSDHCLVHLIPAYRQKLKTSKPVVRTVRKWTVESRQDLQACFDCTDWGVFEAATSDLHELTDTVASYISFCEDLCAD